MLTVKNLLGALTFIASITLGMFIWDAERVISKQDSFDKNANDMSTAISVLTATVKRHEDELADQGGKITGLDKRVLVLETVANESGGQRNKRLDREHLPR